MADSTREQVFLKSLRITCDNVPYSFASVKQIPTHDYEDILGIFKEDEGITVIASIEYFETNNIPYTDTYAKLSVVAGTSPELVRLTPMLAEILDEQNIPANIIASYFHDHIFVPYNERRRAVDVLQALMEIGRAIE
jgi:hypothetical protein